MIPELYKKYFADREDERRMMFKKLSDTYNPQNGIYPGSFIHVTPSFYIPDMTYIDSDKRFGRFFKDDNLLRYITDNKKYSDKAERR